MLVVVRGGLGNQMFQVAHAFSIGRRFDRTPRFIDFSSNARVKRAWELGCFGIEATELSFFEKCKFLISMSLARFLPEVVAFPCSRVLNEEKEGSRLSTNLSPRIISGYWQKPKFFEMYDNEIRELFKFPQHPFLDKIKQSLSGLPVVAIHIRRGDYVNDPVAKKIHYVCNEDWYVKAWEEMRSTVGPCKALVFSDDPEWVEENMCFDGDVTYIPRDAEKEAWVDMKAMSLCHHFIISNSTFSWWAAYLGEEDNKVVIAPRNWFQGRSTRELEICPSSWKLL